MNYRHGYHAGSFSDVFKQIILILLIESLKKKEKPFCYFETHAGSGCYNLQSETAAKTGEYTLGIQKVMEITPNQLLSSNALVSFDRLPEIILFYKNLIQNEGYPLQYPGSPLVAERISRGIDSLILCELHTEEYIFLKNLFKQNKRVACHKRNGYEALKALLPPKEKRGLVFIDPSFEQKTEWEDIIQALEGALKKFSNGIYAIWYPVKDLKAIEQFTLLLSDLKKTHNLSDILKIEMTIYPEDVDFKMMGTGMIVLNPPWQFKTDLEECLPVLWKILSVNRNGTFRVQVI